MINSSELYYLNKALDGEDIYGINSMEGLAINLSSTKIPKETLIEKNMLTKNGKINDVSYALIAGLEKYKNAKEYLWVNDKIAAIDDTEFIIHLERDENENIVLKEVTKSIMLFTIIKENNFLWGDKPVEKNIKYIPVRKIVPQIINEYDDKNVLYIKKETLKSRSLFNIYYRENEDVFKYDVLSQLLKKVNPKDIRLELIKLLNMNWGEAVG